MFYLLLHYEATRSEMKNNENLSTNNVIAE